MTKENRYPSEINLLPTEDFDPHVEASVTLVVELDAEITPTFLRQFTKEVAPRVGEYHQSILKWDTFGQAGKLLPCQLTTLLLPEKAIEEFISPQPNFVPVRGEAITILTGRLSRQSGHHMMDVCRREVSEVIVKDGHPLKDLLKPWGTGQTKFFCQQSSAASTRQRLAMLVKRPPTSIEVDDAWIPFRSGQSCAGWNIDVTMIGHPQARIVCQPKASCDIYVRVLMSHKSVELPPNLEGSVTK